MLVSWLQQSEYCPPHNGLGIWPVYGLDLASCDSYCAT